MFEPHTEWIQKGKHRARRGVGASAADCRRPAPLIQDYDVPVGGADVDQSVPVADRLLGRYGAGSVASLSFDKGFTRAEDRDFVEPVRADRGAQTRQKERGRNRARERAGVCGVAATTQRGGKRDQQLGTSRAEPVLLDVGLTGYRRYVGYGVLSYNLHVTGRAHCWRANGLPSSDCFVCGLKPSRH